MTVTDAKTNFNKITSSLETTILSKKGKPIAAVVPYEEYRKMKRILKQIHEQEAIQHGKTFLNGDRSDFVEGLD